MTDTWDSIDRYVVISSDTHAGAELREYRDYLDSDWHERVVGWVAGTGCDAWIIQRELSDPVSYVNLWLRDAAEPFDPARAQAWLDWFDAESVTGIGFGIVNLRRSGREHPVVRIEDLRHDK